MPVHAHLGPCPLRQGNHRSTGIMIRVQMPIGIALYTWYIERAFSIYMVLVYRCIRTVYRQALYPMFSYVNPMFSYHDVHPMFSSVFLRLKTVYIHG